MYLSKRGRVVSSSMASNSDVDRLCAGSAGAGSMEVYFVVGVVSDDRFLLVSWWILLMESSHCVFFGIMSDDDHDDDIDVYVDEHTYSFTNDYRSFIIRSNIVVQNIKTRRVRNSTQSFRSLSKNFTHFCKSPCYHICNKNIPHAGPFRPE